MSDEAPVNSYASKQSERPKPVTTGKESTEDIAVATPSLGKRLLKQFFAMGPKEMFKHLTDDILVPSAKNAASEAIKGASDLLFFGSSTKTPSATSAPVNYSSISKQPTTTRNYDRSYSFKNVIIPSRKEAIDVLCALQERLTSYDEVTVGYFYDLTNVETNFNDFSYGWKHLNGADVKQTPNGWVLVLPPVVKLAE